MFGIIELIFRPEKESRWYYHGIFFPEHTDLPVRPVDQRKLRPRDEVHRPLPKPARAKQRSHTFRR